VIASHARGETYVLEDARIDPRIEAGRKPLFAALGLIAAVTVPLVRGGRLVGLLSAHQNETRHWSAAEVALVEDVARRTWAAFEHARALARLRESDRNNAFLLELGDRLRRMTDPAELLGDISAPAAAAMPRWRRTAAASSSSATGPTAASPPARLCSRPPRSG
jgi:GAF domain-containing protein